MSAFIRATPCASTGRRSRAARRPRSWQSVVLAAWAATALAGCVPQQEIRVRMGAPPSTGALETTLQVGRSTPAEVAEVLGQPGGKGATLLPVLDEHPRETWTYYFEHSRVDIESAGDIQLDARRTFLFVYFDRGVYDGYMWFSSVE